MILLSIFIFLGISSTALMDGFGIISGETDLEAAVIVDEIDADEILIKNKMDQNFDSEDNRLEVIVDEESEQVEEDMAPGQEKKIDSFDLEDEDTIEIVIDGNTVYKKEVED